MINNTFLSFISGLRLFNVKLNSPVFPLSAQGFSHSRMLLGAPHWVCVSCFSECFPESCLVNAGIDNITPTMDNRKWMSECKMLWDSIWFTFRKYDIIYADITTDSSSKHNLKITSQSCYHVYNILFTTINKHLKIFLTDVYQPYTVTYTQITWYSQLC